MPGSIAVDELASLMGVLSHADRIRIVEALRDGEKDVNALTEELDIAQARVSQHLTLLRNHRVVTKRKEGRHSYYSLAHDSLAGWLAKGLDFIEAEIRHSVEMQKEVAALRDKWGTYG